ncbi:efflux RND transporter periplasmic adaptor subunit [Granulicella paludicola]|uniref:efflux RND transporter periplasmic adaptor subunit n=1 Tax=Granulicella paludicola TaxID=474951 RepID=UPI0021E0F2B2|nr:efflux RND transporter periplasmic adaptor subunit [Granulicella paludicola]
MSTLNRSRKRLWIILGVVAVALISGGVVAAKTLGGSTAIDPTQIATAETGDIARSVVATGKIWPITQVEVKSKASGIVTKLDTDINHSVRKGEVLAQLDQQEILDQVAAQKAQLAAAEANASSAKAAVEYDRVAAESPDLPMVEHSYQRQLEMQKDGVVSKQSLDDAEQKYRAAANTRDRYTAQIIVDQAKLKQSNAQVQQAQASLKQLEEQLSYTTVTSPIDGVVLSRDVQVGDAVSSILVLGSTATLVMTLGDTHEVYVKGKVDESDIAKVYLGQPARIKVQSFRDKTFAGRVTKIAPLGVEKDNVTTFEVQISIDNPGGELKANMTANGEIVLEEHKNVLTIPEQAVIYDKDRNATVWVPDAHGKDGHRAVPVKVGLSNGSRIEVTAGLHSGDKVVLQQTS